jgi:hypothetical protein
MLATSCMAAITHVPSSGTTAIVLTPVTSAALA